MMKQRILFSTIFLFLLLIGASACREPHQFSGTVFEDTAQAFDFTGTNWDGTPFQLSDHRGEVTLLFFGYTFCPDICPFTLTDLNELHEELGEQAEDLNVVFVTVDPERDTVATLAQYVPAFNPDFYGVHIEVDMFESVKTTYGLYVEKRLVEGADEETYFVDHTGLIYVIDKAGNISEVFPPDSGAETMLADITYWLRQRG